MDLGVILLLTALLLSVTMFLAAPLVGGYTRRTAQEGRETSSLLAERDRIINALQELDFDFKLGKVPEEDYPTQRAELLQKGADVLRKLDALAASTKRSGKTNRDESPDAEARIEKAIADRRADSARTATELSDDEIESMLAERRKQHKTKSTGFCPRCGKSVLATDQFCPHCGKALR